MNRIPTPLEEATDTVLRRAVARKDDAIIETYLEIFQKIRPPSRTPPEEKLAAAVRLGYLLGREVRLKTKP